MAKRELRVKLTAETRELQKGVEKSKSSVKNFDKTVKNSGKSVKKSAKDMSQSSAKSVGNLEQGLTSIHPAAGVAVKGMRSASMAARALQAAMGPIGIALMALTTALGALTAYFRESVQGQQQFARIMGYVGGVVDSAKDAFVDLGKWISWAFTNPQDAVTQLWEIIKQNFVNRFDGLVQMVTSGLSVIDTGARGVGAAIAGIFSKEKREQSKQLFKEMGNGMLEFGKATQQALTGVEDLPGKIASIGKDINDRADESYKLADRENKLRLKQVDAMSKIAQLNADIANQRRIANDDQQDINDQISAQEKAMELVEQKFAMQEAMAKEQLAIQQERMALGHDTIEDLEKEAQLQSDLIGLQQSRDNEMRNLLRRHGTLMNQLEGEAEVVEETVSKEQQLRQEALAKQEEARGKILERIRQDSMTELELLEEKMNKELELFKGNEEEKAKVHAYWQERKKELENELAAEKAEREAEEVEKSQSVFEQSGEAMAESLAGIGAGFAESAQAGKDATRDIIKQLEGQIISALIAKIMASPIPFPANLAVAAGAGGMVSGLMGQIPAFADGGKVTSPTLAMFGEYPGARTNPEYALREDQLRNITGGGGGQLTARVSGQDLLFALNEAERRNNASF